MPDAPELFVLIVADAGLRSALTARLTMGGEDVLTATGFGDPELDRELPYPACLVIDERVLADHPAWLDVIGDRKRWARVIIMAEETYGPPATGDRLIFVPKRDAARTVLALAAQWRDGAG